MPTEFFFFLIGLHHVLSQNVMILGHFLLFFAIDRLGAPKKKNPKKKQSAGGREGV